MQFTTSTSQQEPRLLILEIATNTEVTEIAEIQVSKHMSPIYRKSTLARLTSETSAVVCLGFAQTECKGLSPYLHLN